MRKIIKNTKAFAFLQGFYERLLYGDAAGRTHSTNQGWNEAYDEGMNLADEVASYPPRTVN